ncbi:MAG TPA: hypothetical protein VF857_00130, partial [Spirochaetota bacterium]
MIIKAFYTALTLTVFCASIPLYAGEPQSAHNLFLFGNSAASLGRGGTGVSGYGADLFSTNPATAALVERVSLSAQYGSLAGDYYNPELSLLYPSSYGVFGISARSFDMKKNGADLDKGYFITLGGGKDFTETLSLGISVNALTAKSSSTSSYFGSTVGMLYHPVFKGIIGKGIGIYDPRLGIAVNAGVPVGADKKFVNMNQPTIGLNFDFFRNDTVHLGLYGDGSMINGYRDFAAKAGVESLINNSFIIRAGSAFPNRYEYGDFTAGLGYRIRQKSFSVEIDYALVHYKKSTFAHYLGVSAEFGELDRFPPETTVQSSESYISPNNDGKQDFVLISLDVRDQSKIKGWQLQILSPTGSVVKEYRQPNRDVEPSLTIAGFFRKIVSPKESAVVPENVMW